MNERCLLRDGRRIRTSPSLASGSDGRHVRGDGGGDERQIHIGIGGWTYEPWRGVFYPEKLSQKKELEFASRALTSIEINGT